LPILPNILGASFEKSRTAECLFVGQQLAQRGFVSLGLRLLRGDEARGFGTSDAFAGHFADDLGGGEDFFLALARHGRIPRIFAHSTRKNAII